MSDTFKETYSEERTQISLCPKDWTPDKKWVRWLLQKGDHEQFLTTGECTLSVERGETPIYKMGHKEPIGFATNRRTIKGALTSDKPFPKIDHHLYLVGEDTEKGLMMLHIPNIEAAGTMTLELNDVEHAYTLHFVAENIVPWQPLHTTK